MPLFNIRDRHLRIVGTTLIDAQKWDFYVKISYLAYKTEKEWDIDPQLVWLWKNYRVQVLTFKVRTLLFTCIYRFVTKWKFYKLISFK